MKKKLWLTAGIISASMPLIIAVYLLVIALVYTPERADELAGRGTKLSGVELFHMALSHFLRYFWHPLLIVYFAFTLLCFALSAVLVIVSRKCRE